MRGEAYRPCIASAAAALVLLGLPSVARADTARAIPPKAGPGLEDFNSPKLDVAKWLEFLDSPHRDVASNRDAIVSALGLKPGMRVADIGAGSGLFMDPISRAIGPTGRYLAQEISPGFAASLRARADSDGLDNVTVVLGSPSSAGLPSGYVDLAFICDTYVHFRNPTAMLASVRAALVPGGTLVVVDFDLSAGDRVPWLKEKVRASKETYRGEIEAAGFRFEGEEKIEGMRFNFFYRFRRM